MIFGTMSLTVIIKNIITTFLSTVYYQQTFGCSRDICIRIQIWHGK